MIKYKHFILIVVVIFSVVVLFIKCKEHNRVFVRKTTVEKAIIKEETSPNLTIRQGLVSQRDQIVRVKRGEKTVAVVKLSSPVTVAQALQPEEWGYFQFPSISRTDEGFLIVSWQMALDSHTTYGKGGTGRMMSKDEGNTWVCLDKDYYPKGGYMVERRNGDILQIITPATRSKHDFTDFPEPVNKELVGGYRFYRESELPTDLQGVYLNLRNHQDHTITRIHAKLNDPGLLRYEINGQIPLVWWGDIKEQKDNSLLAGIYPGYYLDEDGKVTSYGVSFYKSNDNGYNWDILGKIPYQKDVEQFNAIYTEEIRGFSEPTFTLLSDSIILCVMRTGHNTPMYKSISTDDGKHWSKAVPFTSNGVKPHLLRLGNGVIALSSGRPGVQLRFCIEGDGEIWTEPIDMLPFMNNNKYDLTVRNRETCGYTDIMPVNDHTLYMVYSDFKTTDAKGNYRKSIIFRKVEIEKRP